MRVLEREGTVTVVLEGEGERRWKRETQSDSSPLQVPFPAAASVEFHPIQSNPNPPPVPVFSLFLHLAFGQFLPHTLNSIWLHSAISSFFHLQPGLTRFHLFTQVRTLSFSSSGNPKHKRRRTEEIKRNIISHVPVEKRRVKNNNLDI